MNAISSTATGTPYAPMWRRVLAYAIDVAVGLHLLLLVSWCTPRAIKDVDVVFVPELILALWLYSATMQSSRWQATLGKRALVIKVTTDTGERISLRRASIRFVLHILNHLTLYAGFLMSGFTQRRQGLHDLAARTVVVRRRSTAVDIVSASRPDSGEGWAWLVIYLLSAAISITIAIPNYRDRTIRAEVQSGVGLARYVEKASAAYFYKHQATWPTAVTGVEDTLQFEHVPSNEYVTSVQITAPGIVTISYGNRAHSIISGTRLSLRAAFTPEGAVTWFCGNEDRTTVGDEFFPMGRGPTSVPNRYLPYDCRASSELDADR